VVDEARDVAETLGVDRVSVVIQIVQIKDVLLRVVNARRTRLHPPSKAHHGHHGKYTDPPKAMGWLATAANRMRWRGGPS
jgi:hypothetical protein